MNLSILSLLLGFSGEAAKGTPLLESQGMLGGDMFSSLLDSTMQVPAVEGDASAAMEMKEKMRQSPLDGLLLLAGAAVIAQAQGLVPGLPQGEAGDAEGLSELPEDMQAVLDGLEEALENGTADPEHMQLLAAIGGFAALPGIKEQLGALGGHNMASGGEKPLSLAGISGDGDAPPGSIPPWGGEAAAVQNGVAGAVAPVAQALDEAASVQPAEIALAAIASAAPAAKNSQPRHIPIQQSFVFDMPEETTGSVDVPVPQQADEVLELTAPVFPAEHVAQGGAGAQGDVDGIRLAANLDTPPVTPRAASAEASGNLQLAQDGAVDEPNDSFYLIQPREGFRAVNKETVVLNLPNSGGGDDAAQQLASLPGNGQSTPAHAANDAGAASKLSTLRSDLPFHTHLMQHTAATPPSEQVLVKMEKALRDGVDRISIQLDPPELGRVHVRLEVSHDGKTQVLVASDSAATHDLLQRDGRLLERALQDAGLQLESGNLAFEFRGEQGGGENGESAEWEGAPAVEGEAEAGKIFESAGEYLLSVNNGLNIRV